ncbi:MAG: TetR/AcrR family transcriptional regulator [Gammaproteobacteria bacterium]|nr:TetR/AcrR family transcriptional regulator [Gammaproteobacteria bacterium]
MLEEKRLSARKKPKQQRSRQTVERILDATRELLKSTDGAGSARLTTHQIARTAGISVGSLYQYFPNTEAVVFEVYREILDKVQTILDEFDSMEYLALPRDEFFEILNRKLTEAEPDTEIVLAMLNVSKTYPMLQEEERRHAERTAKRIAAFLRHYGSTWPMKKLERLVLYVFYMDHGAWMYRAHVDPERKEILDWEVATVNFVMMQCFD